MSRLVKSKKVVNKALFASKVSTMIENGRQEITTREEIEEFPVGSLISYLNTDKVFRPGGYILKFKPDYFIYLSFDFKVKRRARYSHIDKMWAGSVYSTKNDFVSIIKATNKISKYPVMVDDTIIYYAPNSYDAKRFKNTEKYLSIVEWKKHFDDN